MVNPLNRVNVGELGDLSLFSMGGNSKLYTTSAFPGLIAKRYSPAIDDNGEAKSAAYDRGVEVLSRERVAWPVDWVFSGDEVWGVLLPVAPSSFLISLPSGRKVPRDLGYLLLPVRASRVGVVDPGSRGRLEFLRDLASITSALSEVGLVHLDLSPKNLLWSDSKPVSSYLLDADSIHDVRADRNVRELGTFDWADPDITPGAKPDVRTMSYSLGLITARLFEGNDWHPSLPSSLSDLTHVPQALRDLALRSIGPIRGRPGPEEWNSRLSSLAIDSLPPPSGSIETANTDHRGRIAWGGLTWDAQSQIALALGGVVGILTFLVELWILGRQ